MGRQEKNREMGPHVEKSKQKQSQEDFVADEALKIAIIFNNHETTQILTNNSTWILSCLLVTLWDEQQITKMQAEMQPNINAGESFISQKN